MKVWITKYALTKGVIQANAEIKRSGQYIYASGRLASGQRFFTREWYGTVDEALEKARQMRDQQLALLTKRIERLKKMSFERKS